MKQKLGKHIFLVSILVFQSLLLTGCGDKEISVDVKKNDVDVMVHHFERKDYKVGQDPYEIVKYPVHGTLEFIPGTITRLVCAYITCKNVNFDVFKVLYTPTTNYIGKDSFKLREHVYTQNDDGKLVQTTTTTININVVESNLTKDNYNNIPIANELNITIDYETETDFNLTGSDKDNDTLTFVIESNTSNGTIVLIDETTGDVTYTPNQGYSGSDNFTFKVVDENNASSNIADVNITVKSLCDLDPTASGCPLDPCEIDPTDFGCPLDPCLLDPFSIECQNSIPV